MELGDFVICNIILVFFILLPLGALYLGAQRTAKRRKELVALRRQYFLLATCLFIGSLKVIINHPLIDLILCSLLIYLGINVFRNQVTVIPIIINILDLLPFDPTSSFDLYYRAPYAMRAGVLYVGLAIVFLADALVPYIHGT